MANKKAIFAILVFFLLVILPGYTLSPNTAVATLDEVEWSTVKIPTEGVPGDWVLASGSDVRHLKTAIDGTLYCSANPTGTSYTLFKSTDGGYSWSYTGKVEDTIVDITTAPDDAGTVYYATTSSIYKSIDAGRNFDPLPPSPGGTGSNNLEITCMDIALLDSDNIIAVGTTDTDSSEFGGVYILDENKVLPVWLDTGIGNCDISGIAFSPEFPANRQLIAVATDEIDTFVISRINDSDWGKIIGGATIQGVVATSAAIAFPDIYDIHIEECVLFVGIDTGTGGGDVYKVRQAWAPDSSETTNLDIGSAHHPSSVDVTSIAVSGEATTASLLAGAANSAQVYISTDGGSNWEKSTKEPTGQSRTYVLMAPDFGSRRLAYVATSGTESAFSCSPDGGTTWNQVSLIDTRISNIIDLAVSPEYRQDNPRFMLTFNGDNGEHSLWRRLNSGTTWERVLSSTLTDIDTIKLVCLPPQYGSSQVVFLAGTSNGNAAIWKSTNDGQTFTPRRAPLSIDALAVISDDTLFIGGYDGSNGLVYHTINSGWFFSDETEVGSQSLNSIAISPDYEQDKTILVGNTTGQVYLSTDNGTSFEPLGQQLPLSAGLGNVTVAFDPGFAGNKTVYAASDAETATDSRERIHRFIIDRSDNWESIDDTLPDDALINQLVISAEGLLYAVNSQQVDATNGEGGMERSLEPTYPLSQTFETVTHGLDDGATLNGLWACENQLWSIDTTDTKLMTYIDTLSVPVTLDSPPNEAPGLETTNVHLDWAGLAGADEYKWQLDYETDFTSVPDGFEDNTDTSMAYLPELEPATKYYWRVRATKPVLSPWSSKWSFTTVLGSSNVACKLLSPEAGVSDVPLKPVFQWGAVAGADSYELLVSTDAFFASPLIAKIGDYALPATAWQSNISLEYDTTYYWKVRAGSSNSYSTWSAVGAFTTNSPLPEPTVAEESSPAELLTSEPSQSEPPQPEPSTVESQPYGSLASPPLVLEVPPLELPPVQLTVPDWAIYSTLALQLTVVLLIVILLVLVVITRRS